MRHRTSARTVLGLAAAGAAVLVLAGTGSAASQAKPSNTSRPTISGTPQDNRTLTATTGSWSGDKPMTFTFTWQRCDTNGNGCSSTGASSSTYKVTSHDVGHRLVVVVTARNAEGQDSEASLPTDVVTKAATKPSNTALPTVSGTAQDNQTLTAGPGSWSGTTPISYAYEWLRCDSNGNGCRKTGATGTTYRVSSQDVGHRLRVSVTATNSAGSQTAVSAATDPATPAGIGPRNTAPPAISGTAQDNATLSATAGAWTGTAPITFGYQWLRCDANGNNCVVIAGATAAAYRVTSADVGHRLRISVTGTNVAGASTATSVPSAVAIAAGPAGAIRLANGTTSIPVTSVSLPDRLIVDRVSFSPPGISSRTRPVLGRFRVVDSNGYVVRGALVYAIGVPSNRVAASPETQTREDGWATVQFVPLRALPLKRGALLTIFVRARKGGENILGGVSTRRLVSIRVRP